MPELEPFEPERSSVSRAMTVDFSAPLPVAERLDIPKVISTLSGRILDAGKLMSKWSYGIGIKVRFKALDSAKTGKPRYLCGRCLKAVKLAGHAIPHQGRKVFYFKHAEGDQGCDWRTDGLSEDIIRARQYKGQAEGEPHKRMKASIVRSLEADPSVRAVIVEKIWKPEDGDEGWRKPDVAATYLHSGVEIRIAFEAQLSRTFLSVVVDRTIFYRSNGGLLVWVMPAFTPDDRLLMHDDIFIANNANMLVVDEETTRLSEALRRFMIRVHWQEPERQGDKIRWTWQERIVPFSDLTLDLKKQRAFLFDSEQTRHEIEKKIAEDDRVQRVEAEQFEDTVEAAALRPAVLAREAEDEVLRREFLDLLQSKAVTPIAEEPWEMLRVKFAKRGILLPSWLHYHELMPVAQAIASAREGRPIGYRYDTLLQVGHNIFDHYKHHLRYFARALVNYRKRELIESQDRNGVWAERVKEMRERWAARDPVYRSDPTWRETLDFLFPGALAK